MHRLLRRAVSPSRTPYHSLLTRHYTTMASRSYNDAVRALNSLQSNFAILTAIKASRMDMNAQAIPEMIEWVRRIGYTPSDFNKLNIIHVAGTKGKGSTCAFTSSILNEYRLSPPHIIRKTGLFTSPHLRAVRERIQINGASISEDEFAKYFFEVWDRIESSAEKEGLDKKDKPAYFRFLTLVAFHAYLREGVDTAIFEVGVGGEYDSTNVIKKPTVTGITSLGIDHTGVLGETLEEIAWHKAGIFKPGSPAFSVEQPENALKVLEKRAAERNTQLQVVKVHPEIANGSTKLGLEAEFMKGNASLAVAIVGAHLKALGHDINIPSGPLPEEIKRGLKTVQWAGRCQTIKEGSLEWFIDGAHTTESLHAAGQWFAGKTTPSCQNRVLIFNQQNRDAPEKLAEALSSSLKTALSTSDVFTHAVFCTNVTFKEQGYKPDLMSVGAPSAAIAELTVQKGLAKAWKEQDENAVTEVRGTIEEAVEYARGLEGETQVLVTGSLHLVGGLLEVLDVGK
ncbi:putative tetrahydrofolylpolyglutamate synthase [Ascodesmis nigricans]|uniref:Folylpolyglutamate synthase n=1 Tax=Ascodesmis nigricans TaxID=341454 RepID=A0A4S2MZI7_9PEZI|nr:putative tetrahydrofolylpolyglutamate synthase [Ascodesmis nigricans]